jgi:ribosomal protein L37AE/L43A
MNATCPDCGSQQTDRRSCGDWICSICHAQFNPRLDKLAKKFKKKGEGETK